jgi:hypothetical protein
VPRVLTAAKACRAALTEADAVPDGCGAAFSAPAMLSDMPDVHPVPIHDVLSWDVEGATWEAMTEARREPAWRGGEVLINRSTLKWNRSTYAAKPFYPSSETVLPIK